MRFSELMLKKVLAGEKTVTRRPVKYNTAGKNLLATYKVGGGPGGTYALQGPREEGSKARARTIEGYRLRVTSVTMEKLGAISGRGARLEGFKDRTGFLLYWACLYGKALLEQQVWRYEFELVEEGRGG